MAAAAATSWTVWTDGLDSWARACEDVFSRFRGVEHRLEFVDEIRKVRVYNDSIATNPDSTLAALETIQGPVVLLAGGSDKNLSFDALAAALPGQVRALVVTGATGEKIAGAAAARPGAPEIVRREGFDDAVEAAWSACRPGDVLLFSPACASFDQFRNFADRGRRFKERIRRVQ